MKRINLKSLVTILEVKDMEAALEWYQKWLGKPDVIPMEGIAEYQIAENAWIQLSCEGKEEIAPSSIVLGVDNIKEAHKSLTEKGIEVGEIMDYEVVLVFDIVDTDGNRISFVQEVE